MKLTLCCYETCNNIIIKINKENLVSQQIAINYIITNELSGFVNISEPCIIQIRQGKSSLAL